MILRLAAGTPEDVVQALRERLESEGLRVLRSSEEACPILAIAGTVPDTIASELRARAEIEQIVKPTGELLLAARAMREAAAGRSTVVDVGGVRVGGDEVVVIAGPCSVEGRELVLEVAKKVAECGAHLLRGGAFKPRTSPYAFQGFGVEGLRQLKDAGEAVGLPVVSEIMDASDVPSFLVARYADILQVGARNMQNYALLREVGHAENPVLLKRGLAATAEEWLYAAEYLFEGGCEQVILCERGIRTFEKATRNTLDLTVLPLLREWTHVPIIVDPAHAAGIARIIPPLARSSPPARRRRRGAQIRPRPATDRRRCPRARRDRLRRAHPRRGDGRRASSASKRKGRRPAFREAGYRPPALPASSFVSRSLRVPLRLPYGRAPSHMRRPRRLRETRYGAFRPAARVGVFTRRSVSARSRPSSARRVGHHVVDAEADRSISRACSTSSPAFVSIRSSRRSGKRPSRSRASRARGSTSRPLGGPHVAARRRGARAESWADAAAIGEGEETILEFARAIVGAIAGDRRTGRALRRSNVRSGARANSRPRRSRPRSRRPAEPSLPLRVPARSPVHDDLFRARLPVRVHLLHRARHARPPRPLPLAARRRRGDRRRAHRPRREPLHLRRRHADARRGPDPRDLRPDPLAEARRHAGRMDPREHGRREAPRRDAARRVRAALVRHRGRDATCARRSRRHGSRTHPRRVRWAAAGLETRGSVILGLPGDTRASVERTIDFVTGLRDLDHCYFNIAMPYPGTEMRRRALAGEGGTRLLTKDYSALRRQGQSVVMEVNDLDPSTLLALQRRAYRKFWLHPRRVAYNVRRAGLSAGVGNSWAFLRSFVLPARSKSVAFRSEITAMSEMQTASR
jgi:3-deoxy-7-phosphoheptulonate synthase